MSNFHPKIQDSTKEQLLHIINESSPIFGPLASDELTRRAIKELNESIDKGTLQAKESSDRTEKFTIAMFLLAIVQLLVAIFQFIYTFAYTDNTQGKVFGIIMIVVTAVVFVYFSWKVFKIEK
jgi:hypothetical protein